MSKKSTVILRIAYGPMEEMQILESGAFRRLRELLVLGQSHVSKHKILAPKVLTAEEEDN